jgi:hypothetical protein
MILCYWCQKEAVPCPVCGSLFGRLETCANCQGTGLLCGEHGVGWVGDTACSPEEKEAVEKWLDQRIRDLPENMWRAIKEHYVSVPFTSKDELDYLAFYADYNSYRHFPVNNRELLLHGWLRVCRDSAIEAGGTAPNALRSEPIEPRRELQPDPVIPKIETGKGHWWRRKA